MKTMLVSDLMVPLAEYATVSEEATLFEAVMELERAQSKFDKSLYLHRAILVYDEEGKITGKLSQLDALKALEPKYGEMIEEKSISRFGFTPQFLESMLQQFKLFDKPLNDLCRKASQVKVKKFMSTPSKGEYIDQSASLDIAIHQLIMGNNQSLLVTAEENDIVGILRLTDVFKEIFQRMKACNL